MVAGHLSCCVRSPSGGDKQRVDLILVTFFVSSLLIRQDSAPICTQKRPQSKANQQTNPTNPINPNAPTSTFPQKVLEGCRPPVFRGLLRTWGQGGLGKFNGGCFHIFDFSTELTPAASFRCSFLWGRANLF